MSGYYEEITLEVAENDVELREMAAIKLESESSSFDVTAWTNYYARIVPKHTTDRLVVFKPPEHSTLVGCIRVRDKDNTETKLWDAVSKKGHYVGLVPAGCQFEAMVVDAKMITPT